jgi:enoyl-CoA hydratase/carnithine racemase
MPAYRTLLVAVDRGVATITLNRPQQRDAIRDGMRDELDPTA